MGVLTIDRVDINLLRSNSGVLYKLLTYVVLKRYKLPSFLD